MKCIHAERLWHKGANQSHVVLANLGRGQSWGLVRTGTELTSVKF